MKKPDFPNTLFSLPVEPRKSLMESRVRAIVESANGRRGRTSVPVAVLVLLVCFFCVNLVSCAAVRADSDASSDTLSPAVQSEPPASQPEPTETAPVNELEPAAPERPRDSILKVLTGEGEAHYHYTSPKGESTDKYLDISEIAVSYIAEGEPIRARAWISRFAVVDMDGDGVNEAVLEGNIDDWPAEYMILHLRDGEVRFCSVMAKGMWDLKTDGTHGWMDGVTHSGYCRITDFADETYRPVSDDFLYYETDFDTNTVSYYINHQPVSKAAYDKAEEEQLNKPDVEWHDFAGADFSLYFD